MGEKIPEELEAYFTQIRTGKPLDYLSQFICPHLVGDEWVDIRKAGLMLLLSQECDSKTRMRLHLLLVGLPGSGKTEYLLSWRENLGGILINGELCSKTGLVGDARGNRVTPGLLADYDSQILEIDELDKMPMRDQSVTGNTPVIIKVDGKIKIIEIKDAGKYSNFEALSVNPVTLKVEWKKVNQVSKHMEHRKVLKIDTIRRQQVTATVDHSFLKYDFEKDRLMPIKGSGLKEGDLIPFISEMPVETNNTEYSFTVDYIGIEELREKAHIWRDRLVKMLPLEKYEKKGSRGWQIPYEDAKTICPDLKSKKIVFPLNYDLGFLTGFWIAEGDINLKRLRFANTDKNILKYIQSTLKMIPAQGNRYSGGFFVSQDKIKQEHKQVWRLCVQNIYLFDFLSLFIDEDIYASLSGKGKGSRAKIIPSFCFNFPDDFISGLLCGYFTGDGTVGNNINATTTSKKLASGISMLLLKLKIGNYIKSINCDDAYKIMIPSYFTQKFAKKIGFMGENRKKLEDRLKNDMYGYNATVDIPINYDFFRKHTKGMLSYKYKNVDFIRTISRCSRKGYLPKNTAKRFNKIIGSKTLKKLIDSNIYWMPIKKIEKINCNDYVYDFSVEDNENFVLANGMIVHNSGLLQAMEEGQYIIVKGKHRQPFKAEVRVIGSVNEIDKVQKPLLDRFDFVYRCKIANREDRAEQTPKIVDSFIGKTDEEITKILRGYINWLGDFTPVIMPENRADVVEAIQTYLLKSKGVEIEKVSYRSLEMSILRIAWAMAKLQKKNIERQDVIEAIVFKDKILKRLYGVAKR